MRASGVRGLLIYCSDYKCAHWTLSADPWPDEVRLSDIEGVRQAWCRCPAGLPLGESRSSALVLPLRRPNSLPDGRKLVTLKDAKATLLSLWPELPDEQKRPGKGADASSQSN